MSDTDPPPASDFPPATDPAGPAPASGEGRAKRNPWLWATIGVAVIAVALGIWGLHERSNADDAKADLQAQQEKAIPPATTQAETETQQPTSTQETQPTTATTEDSRQGVGVAALAAAAAAFGAARRR